MKRLSTALSEAFAFRDIAEGERPAQASRCGEIGGSGEATRKFTFTGQAVYRFGHPSYGRGMGEKKL